MATTLTSDRIVGDWSMTATGTIGRVNLGGSGVNRVFALPHSVSRTGPTLRLAAFSSGDDRTAHVGSQVPGTMLRDYALHLVFWAPPPTTLDSDVESGMEQLESDIQAALAAGQDGNIFSVPGDYTDASGPGDPRIASIDTTNDSDPLPADQAGIPCQEPTPCVTQTQVSQEVSSLAAEKGWTPGEHTLVLVVLASPVLPCDSQACGTAFADGYHGQTADGYAYAVDFMSAFNSSVPAVYEPSYAEGLTGHEQNEAIVDPSGAGLEIADPCSQYATGPLHATNEINGHLYEMPYLLLPSGVCSLVVAALDTTSTSVACSPSRLARGGASTCTATVTDTFLPGAVTPTGTVSFTALPSSGSFGSSSSCLLVQSARAGVASCNVSFMPSAAGSYTVTGGYGGDSEHQTSSGQSGSITAATSTSPPPPGRGSASVGPVSVSGTTASVSVSCSGSGSCRLTLRLSVLETLKRGKLTAVAASAQRTKKTVVVGAVTVTVAAGTSETVKLNLNATGKRLLPKHNPLKAKLTLVQSGKTVAGSTVTFKLKQKTNK
ncbi:MAG: Ig-like domain-containing protein [Solirubrobacteraceae bacterium]